MKNLKLSKLSNKQLITIIVACGVLLFILFVYLIFRGGTNNPSLTDESSTSQPQVVNDATNNNGTFGLNNAGKPSAVCESINKQAIAEITGEKVEQEFASIPNTETQEGSVAGCTYKIAKSDNQKLRSIIIVKRTLESNEAAQKSYDTLGKDDATKVENSGDETYILNGSRQALILKGKSITTVSFSVVDNDIENIEDMVREIAQKL